MPTYQAIQIPPQVIEYLRGHHIITLGTASFTGMPHAATSAYASDASGVYFSMPPEELTLRNIGANHWASFTIDDYTPDFRKVRELRGVGRVTAITDPEVWQAAARLFVEKLPELPRDALANMHHIAPLEVHFVDFQYAAGVTVPMESNIVYEAAAAMGPVPSAAMSAQLQHFRYEPGDVIVHQGERSDRFFIVVEGEIETRREGHGQDVVVTRHGPGQFFGEVGALTGAPQTATFTAVQRTIVMAIDRDSFQSIVTQSAAADFGQRVRATRADLDQPAS
jgi:hypothetical protein